MDPGEPAAPLGQPHQPSCRRGLGAPLSSSDRKSLRARRSRSGAAGGRFPHGLQCGTRTPLHPAPGRAGLAARALLPRREEAVDPAAPRYLDETAIDTPAVALACAARETLHMGDIVETMLQQTITAMMNDDRKLVAEICAPRQRGRPARRGHQALRHQGDPREPRRPERPPRHGDHLLHHQPRAHRRHHRQEPDGARRQEDQAQAPILQGGSGRARGLPPARGRQPEARASASSCRAT